MMFGTELRQRREAAGRSLVEPAERVRYTEGSPGKIEKCSEAPTERRRDDDDLGAAGRLRH